MRKFIFCFIGCFITILLFAKNEEWGIYPDAGFGNAKITIESTKKNDDELIIFYSEIHGIYGFLLSDKIKVPAKDKSKIIMGKIEILFQDNQKLNAEGIIKRNKDIWILDIATENKNEIFLKIFKEKVFVVNISFHSESSDNKKNNIQKNIDFRQSYSNLSSDGKLIIENVLNKLQNE